MLFATCTTIDECKNKRAEMLYFVGLGCDTIINIQLSIFYTDCIMISVIFVYLVKIKQVIL